MILYFFDEQRIFCGSSQVDDTASIPGNALTVEPPILYGPQTAQANAQGDGWDIVEDYRHWHVVDADGNEVAITAIGPLPDGYRYSPDGEEGSEESSRPTLEQAKTKAHADIAERRKKAEYGGFLFNGQRWDSDQKDEMRLNSMTTMMEKSGRTAFEGWKIAEGVYITLTAEIAWGAAAAMLEHYNACFSIERAKRQALEEAGLETPAQVSAWLEEHIHTGWPESSQEDAV